MAWGTKLILLLAMEISGIQLQYVSREFTCEARYQIIDISIQNPSAQTRRIKHIHAGDHAQNAI